MDADQNLSLDELMKHFLPAHRDLILNSYDSHVMENPLKGMS
jgi:hypothetical protein